MIGLARLELLGGTVTIGQVLKRLKSRFGDVGDSVMQEFYTASQKQDESITEWSLRLKDILKKTIKKGNVKKEDKDKMLRDRFFNYLRRERLENTTRTKHDNTIISGQFCRSLKPRPETISIESLNLRNAGGFTMPFLPGRKIDVFTVVVPNIQYNLKVSVDAGTNIIWAMQ